MTPVEPPAAPTTPGPAWPGAISYSVYPLHFVVIYLTKRRLVPGQDGAW